MLALQLFQLGAQSLDPLAYQAAVGLELCFAGSAQANTALLPFQVGPAADQACGKMLQLGQFDLDLAFMALRALRKNIEDQAGAVDDTDLEHPFEIALLGRRQRMIEYHEIEMSVFDRLGDFLRLPGSDVKRRVRTGTLAQDGQHRFGACRTRQQAEFVETGSKISLAKIDADESRAHVSARPVAVGSPKRYSASDSRLRVIARAGTTVEIACL